MGESLKNDDVIVGKISIIRNCLQMIKKATSLRVESLDDQMIEVVFVLNLQRAIGASIAMANYVIATKGYAIPKSYKESFIILRKHGLINGVLSDKLQKMTGFRNIAVHDYQALNKFILKKLLTDHLVDFE